MNRVFHEKSGVPLWTYYMVGLLLLPILGIFLWGIYMQLLLGQDFGSSPASDNGLIAIAIGVFFMSVAMFWILTRIRIEIRVADKQVSFRFPPFINKERTYSIDEIDSWTINKKSFFKTGIGLRFDLVNNAKIYSTGTSHVLNLKLKSGKNLMISTRQPEELKRAIESTQRQDYD